jgi:hypothetical protein
MEKFTEKLKAIWLKIKTFMVKKWMGAPMYVWVFSPLVLIVGAYFLIDSRPRKNKL